MTTKTIREIALAWKSDKQRYVKQSTYAAYVLILENHLLPSLVIMTLSVKNWYRSSSYKNWRMGSVLKR